MISIVVPILIRNIRNINNTIKCLESIKKTFIKYELIIVETESQYFIDYADFYIHEKYKTNATKSINRGFKIASGDYVVLVTNDIILEQGWLEALYDCFKYKEDCGLSTLATSQLGHNRQDKIEEGIWFSVAMIPKDYAIFDEHYINSWDDSDIIMRVYLDNKKMYRNYNIIVEHDTGSTQYLDKNHEDNLEKNRLIFMNKYKNNSSNRMYKILTEGIIL